MVLTSNDFSGLLSERFFRNFFPIPATNCLTVGETTPDFQLPDISRSQQSLSVTDTTPHSATPPGMSDANENRHSGHMVRLSNYKGKQPVILAFTRIFTEKQYCPLCFPHIKALNENYGQFTSRGVEVLMITSTDERQSQKVVKDLGIKMPFLSDPSCRVFRAYGVGQALGAPLPAQFVLDRQGKLRYKHLFSFLSNNASVERLLQAVG